MLIRDSLIDELFRSTQINSSKLALAEHQRNLTYAELWKSISLTSDKLESLGVKNKDRVLFSIKNSIDFIILHFAILKVGGISVPVDVTLSDGNLNTIVEDLDPVLIISETDLSDRLVNNESNFCNHNDLKITDDEIIDYTFDKTFITPTSKNDLVVILYTSGSTGVPKGVMLTNNNTLITINNIISFCNYNSNCCELVTLPLTHSFGLGQVYSMLFSGGSAFIEMGMLRMKRIFKAMDDYRITGFPTTPKGVELITTQYSEIFKEKAKDLEGMIINSAPLLPHQTKELLNLLPGTKIYVYYGLTEASRSSFVCLSDLDPALYTTVGKAMDSVNISLENTTKEILISGPTVSQGYWPSELFEISDEDFPILKTGDLGTYDSDGNLYITGRLKDQINVGGYKVDPLEIEKIIIDMPNVKEIAVIGKQVGSSEEIVYCVVSKDTKKINKTDIEEFCRKKIEHYKMPQIVINLEKLPEGVNGKIDRKELKSKIENI